MPATSFLSWVPSHLRWPIGVTASLIPMWLVVSIGGFYWRPSFSYPPIPVSESYVLEPHPLYPMEQMEEVRLSIELHYPDYRNAARQGRKILVARNPNKGGTAGFAKPGPDGTCNIFLNPSNPEYNRRKTPAHEFNHCRRGDYGVPETMAGFAYYVYVEICPMALELLLREHWPALGGRLTT